MNGQDEKRSPSTVPSEDKVEGLENGNGKLPTNILYQIWGGLSTPDKEKIKQKIYQSFLVDKKCVKCGKNFVTRSKEYAWKDCCSYTCYLHRDDGLERQVLNGKPVNQYNEWGTFLATYPSAALAAKAVGMKKADNIRDCCNGKTKTSGGFYWRWREETETAEKERPIVVPVIKRLRRKEKI